MQEFLKFEQAWKPTHCCQMPSVDELLALFHFRTNIRGRDYSRNDSSSHSTCKVNLFLYIWHGFPAKFGELVHTYTSSEDNYTRKPR